MTDLLTEARALYARPLAEFTAARNDRAKQVRVTEGRELAAAVKALPKPSVSAWAVNMLARHRPEELGDILATGEELRSAQDGGGRWSRELDRRRRQVLAAATRATQEVAGELGQKISAGVTEEVEATLRAAMADADAAAAVAAGLLVRPLTATGLQPVDLTGAVAVPGATDSGEATHDAAKAEGSDSTAAQDDAEVESDEGDAGVEGATELDDDAEADDVAAPRGAGVASADEVLPDEPTLRAVPPRSRARERPRRPSDADRRERARTEAAVRARARARERAQDEALSAQKVFDHAAEELRAATAHLQDLQARALQVNAEADELRRRVAEVEARADRLGDAVAAAEEARDAADDAYIEAEADAQTAQEALSALTTEN